MHPDSVIIDGHAGSGKTTLARSIAESQGFAYVKAFDGTTGDVNTWLYGQGRTTDLVLFRRIICEHAVDRNAKRPAVFDRLFPSSLSLISPNDWPDRLPFAEQTVICWCPAKLAMTRLAERGRDIWSVEEHRQFCQIFADIAARYRLLVINTGVLSAGDALESIGQRFIYRK